MAHARKPAVAGLFYPEEEGALLRAVTALMAEAKTAPPKEPPKALIVPHAGYVYSGAIAAKGYAMLKEAKGKIKRVILLGPAHTVYLRGMAIPEADCFEMPLATHTVDADLTGRALKLPAVISDDQPHLREHALEVQLPFIWETLGEVRILPVVVGDTSEEDVSSFIGTLWDGPETLILISSDLSHYYPYDVARKKDGATARAIESLNPGALSDDKACGFKAIQGLLQVARDNGLSVRRLGLCNSGDTAGERTKVVGYGAWGFWEPS